MSRGNSTIQPQKQKRPPSSFPTKRGPVTLVHAWDTVHRDENDMRIRVLEKCKCCRLTRTSIYAKQLRPPIGDAMSLYGVPGTWTRTRVPVVCAGPG